MRGFVRIGVFSIIGLIAVSLMAISLSAQTTDKQKAEKAWEALIKEKGGRARLHGIDTFMFAFVEKEKPTYLSLHVPPSRLWNFLYHLDGTPRTYRSDSSRPLQEWANPDGTGDFLKEDASPRFGLERVIYLLETRFEKPTLLRVSRKRIGKATYDVLETSLGDERIDFYFEPEAMLVMRVVLFYADARVFRTYVFSDYTEIDGIKMPQWQGNEERSKIYGLRFAFNVDYDPVIFTEPLKVTTIDGWKRKSN
jgi:hypothetical protein